MFEHQPTPPSDTPSGMAPAAPDSLAASPAGSTSAAGEGSAPAARAMRIAPLDLRQQRFKTAMRGFDRTEVVAFLTEAAADYEHALREIDRLRQDLQRLEGHLVEHRDRETNLRNTLLTACLLYTSPSPRD